MLKYDLVKVIDLNDWDQLVRDTYGKPYSFQQQEGCQLRGNIPITIPDISEDWEEEMNDSIPEIINGDEMGVKFDVWLARDPKQPIPNQTQSYELELFWERSFYPHVQSVANDLWRKGLIEAGDYEIKIDW